MVVCGCAASGIECLEGTLKGELKFCKFDSSLLLLHPRLTSQEDVKKVYGREKNY